MTQRNEVLGCCVTFLVLAVLCGAAGAVPREMNYQVMLTNESDDPMSDQSVELIFKIWTASSGGELAWSEEHTTVTNSIGVATVILGGAGSPLDAGFGRDLWLELTVNDETLTPRKKLVASPYAFHAANTDSLGGVAASGYALEGHDHDADYVNEGQLNSVTTDMIQPTVVSSINSVTNDGGNISLEEGDNVTIAADDGANTITISVDAPEDSDWFESGSGIYRESGNVGIGHTPSDNHRLYVYNDGSTIPELMGLHFENAGPTQEIMGIYVSGSNVANAKFIDCVEMPGYQGRFVVRGDGDVWMAGQAEMAGLKMPTAAAEGHVLTSDASGVGTWQAPAGGDDGDWSVSGDDVYRVSGGVGIGTPTPDGDLHMHGGPGGSTMLRMTTDSTGTGFSDGFKLWIDSSGYTFMEQHEDAAMFFSAGGDEILALTPDGRAGIGTLSPGSLLHVAGEAQVNGFKMPTGAGAGHVLTSDASGNGTWQPLAVADDGDWTIDGEDIYRTSGRVGIGDDPVGACRFAVMDSSVSLASLVTFSAGGVGDQSRVLDLELEGDVELASFIRCHEVPGNLGRFIVEGDGDVWMKGSATMSGLEIAGPVTENLVNVYSEGTEAGTNIAVLNAGVSPASSAHYLNCGYPDPGFDSDFRLSLDGNGYADGNWSGGGADLAEMMVSSEGALSLGPGDVLVIDSSSRMAVSRSRDARSKLVAGVYSTKPGFVCSEREWDEPDPSMPNGVFTHDLKSRASRYNEIPVAVVGIVPCKVSAENGPIRAGDLLVTSATPGHAMRDDDPRPGTILGKALESLESGTGMIRVLVTLQ
jgi:hypothetical protein